MPNETGVVQDAKSVYYWLVSQLDGDSDRIIVWGHSLGSGVAGHLVSLLTQEGTGPAGLVLESPFNNIYDEVKIKFSGRTKKNRSIQIMEIHVAFAKLLFPKQLLFKLRDKAVL